MKTSALLAIDIQNDFTQPFGRMPVDAAQAERVIANLNEVIALTHRSNLLPVYIGNEFNRYDPLNLLRNFAALRGSEGRKLDPRLRFASDNYFAKRQDNAFSNPSLTAFLRNRSIEHLYLAGVYAEACIFRTLKGALRLKFSCAVVSDAIAGKTEASVQQMLGKYMGLGGKVVTTADLVESMRRPSG